MAEFADHTLSELLDAVAAQKPAPGGGCSAAWSAALAGGLVEMAASFTLARPRYAGVHHRMLDVRKQAAQARRRLTRLAEEDSENFEPVLVALRLPEKHRERGQKLDRARSNAAETPLAIAEEAATVAELAAETARTGSEHLRGDSITAALLAEGACRAAGRLVEINLAGRDDPRLGRTSEATRRAATARENALAVHEEVLR